MTALAWALVAALVVKYALIGALLVIVWRRR